MVWDSSKKALQAQSMSYQVFTMNTSNQQGRNHA
jgi:hypothetical protein